MPKKFHSPSMLRGGNMVSTSWILKSASDRVNLITSPGIFSEKRQKTQIVLRELKRIMGDNKDKMIALQN